MAVSLHDTRSDILHYHVGHANAGLYPVNTRVFADNLDVYELNADKGLGVPGDPTENPLVGDGSIRANWRNISVSQLETSVHESIQIVAGHIGVADTVPLASLPTANADVEITISGMDGLRNGDAFTVSGQTLTFGTYMKAVFNNPIVSGLPIMNVDYHTFAGQILDGAAAKNTESIIGTYVPAAAPEFIAHNVVTAIALGFDVSDCDFLDMDVHYPANTEGAVIRFNVRNMLLGTQTNGAFADFDRDQFFTLAFADLAAKIAGNATLFYDENIVGFLLYEIRGLKIIR